MEEQEKKKYLKIGYLIRSDESGDIEAMCVEKQGHGYIFKDEQAFCECPEEACYAYQSEEDVMRGVQSICTYNDFMTVADGSRSVAEALFKSVDGQNPEDLLDEWVAAGKIDECSSCGKIFMTEDQGGAPAKKCPYCGAD